MLTKFGKAIVGTQIVSSTSGSSIIPAVYLSTLKGYLHAKDTTGTMRYFTAKLPYISNDLRKSMTNGNGGVAIGSGSTPATEDDYTLENLITTGFSASSPTYSCVYDEVNHTYMGRLQFTINNTGSEDLTINEICLYRSLEYSAELNGNASSSATVMIDRTVLDTPLVIAAGEAGVLNYNFAYPVVE